MGNLVGIPWWVYVLFAYFLFVGIKSIKPRTISIKRTILLPLLFVVWSFYNLYTRLSMGYTSLFFVWIIFLAAGAYWGVLQVRHWKIGVDRRRGEVTIPGNYSKLILFLIIFGVQFFWNYYYATHENVSYWMYFWDILTASLISGNFIGRAWFFFRRYRQNST